MAVYKTVKQSASKEEFLKVLQLDSSEAEDRWKFGQMWEEVTTYWVKNFETTNRNILKDEYKNNMAIHRPFKWAHLSKETIDGAIEVIRQNGRDWPRYYYNIGQGPEAGNNWVIKWLLWHVCRYRDWRNRKGRSVEPSSTIAFAASNRGNEDPAAEGTNSLTSDTEIPERDYWATILN